MLHDPHKIPEPLLVISGCTYIVPFYIAMKNARSYDAITYIFLTFTTIGFHSTRNEFLFALDCFAILNFLIRSYFLSLKCTTSTQIKIACAVVYCFTTYVIGQRYKIMSFDPDWNTQMFYHSLMHISTSYSSYLVMKEYNTIENVARETPA
jgi:hypothetical protein